MWIEKKDVLEANFQFKDFTEAMSFMLESSSNQTINS
jgi:pterin-4a-carbinolamine dehydratase